jgi:hypothetical protein
MFADTTASPIAQLLLARLLIAGEKGATQADLKKSLEPLLGHRWAGSALLDRVSAELALLESAGIIHRTRKGRTERSTLTETGTKRALEVLGLTQIPPKTTWDKLKKSVLAAKALGISVPHGDAAKTFSTDNGFKAALLKASYKLPFADTPKLDDAIAALCWVLLELPADRKFDVKTVQTALIQRALGLSRDLGPKPDPKKELAKLLAQHVGARQSGKDELRNAALRRWVDGEPLVDTDSTTSTQPATIPFERPPAQSGDLESFSRRGVEAARLAPSGRFGDNKVFIVHVWRQLQSDPAIGAHGIDAFKRRLAEANNARMLTLSRADMVEAMDADDVRQSETHYLGSSFHFVRI